MKRGIICAFFALVVLPVSAPAQQHPLRVDVSLGFRGIYAAPGWVPARLTLENLGTPITGELRVETRTGPRIGTESGGYVAEFPLSLGSATRKTFQLVIPVESTVRPLRVVVQNRQGVVAEREYSLPPPLAGRSLMVTLARGAALDGVLVRTLGRTVAPAYPLVEYLPDDWVAYDGVGAMVFYDADLTRLTRGQADGVLKWTRAGGTVVVLAGERFSPAAAMSLAELLPARFEGNRAVAVGLGNEEPGANGTAADGTTAEPLIHSAFEAPDSAVAVRAGDVPLLWEFAEGRGRIRILTVDPLDLAGRLDAGAPLWRRVFEPARPRADVLSPPVAARGDIGQGSPIDELLEWPVYRYLPHWLVFLALAAYVLIVEALLRHRPVWAPVFAVVVLAGLFVTAGPLLHPPRLTTYSLEILRTEWNEPVGLVDKSLVLLATEPTAYRGGVPPEAVAVPTDPGTTLVEAGTRFKGEVEAWAPGVHRFAAVERAPLSLSMTADGEIRLHNNADHSIRDIVVRRGGHHYLVGTLSPDERARAPLYPSQRALSGLSNDVRELYRELLDTEAGEDEEAALLIGRLPVDMASVERFEPEPSHAVREALLLVRLPDRQGEQNDDS